MSHDEGEAQNMSSLDPEIASMLRRAGDDVRGPTAEREAAILGRLEASIAALPVPPRDGSGGGGGAGGAGGGGGSLVAKVAPYVATLVVGAGLGAIVHARVAPSPPQVVFVDRPQASSPIPPASPPATSRETPSMRSVSIDALPTVSPVASAGRTPSGSASAASGGTADDSFVLERRLLDGARATLASGDAAGTLAKLDDHVRAYPAGRFVEEREAMRVRALADAGRLDEARAAAARFETRWPGSVLLSAVKAAASTPAAAP